MDVQNYTYLPIFLNVEGLRVLVVGGGTVGTKRALKFIESGANVTVVSLDFSEELLDVKKKGEKRINLVKADAMTLIDVNFLEQFNIIVTATSNREVNSKLCTMAKSLNKLCNDPTDPTESSFIIPLYSIEDSIGVAVTTFGKSSLSSKFILELIKEKVLTDEVKRLVSVMGLVKEVIKSKVDDPKKRFPLYSKVFNDERFRDYVKNGQIDKSIKRVEEIIDESA
ncbi:precorrin-2 dehydrogenase/sirohydrochlorin ferrochelatase family protein [Stygiolobus caldivivus]|uniref:precorrin-2 dehydrogenase n=1 Tax=Stygiolobus caldivivus TaxID=2824673 RepID=A0A8D5ZI83_9CREN|nr:NAD(P)-dependent oxidoreductase [Stygiolobus caldivivus]BCU70379.1 siroheme synthase [Stygiolobus caldivivus]